jgi:hypothetical protein
LITFKGFICFNTTVVEFIHRTVAVATVVGVVTDLKQGICNVSVIKGLLADDFS